MSRPRTKSTERNVTLPPAVPKANRDRLDALKKVYSRPQTTHRASRSHSTNGNHLPECPPTRQGTSFGRLNTSQERVSSSFGNGRLPSAFSMNGSRSKSESRYGSALYGRSPSTEKINDLRDELYEAKKTNAQLEIERKQLKTHLHRLARESDKREQHLQRLVIGKFQPAEVNDTHMAKTLTMITQNQIGREQMIRVQMREIEALKKKLSKVTNEKKLNEETPVPRSYPHDFETEDDSDYPQEPDEIRSTENVRPSTSKVRIQFKGIDDAERKNRSKKRIEIAKAYADQNLKLKERLKQLKESYLELQKKNKENKSNLKAMKTNAEIRTKQQEDEVKLIDTSKRDLVAEKELLLEQKKEQIQSLQDELREAYEAVGTLRVENSHLHEQVSVLEEKLQSIESENIQIPKLDMSTIGEGDQLSPVYGNTDRNELHIEQNVLSMVLAEIVGAHAERLDGAKKLL